MVITTGSRRGYARVADRTWSEVKPLPKNPVGQDSTALRKLVAAGFGSYRSRQVPHNNSTNYRRSMYMGVYGNE